VEKTTLGGKELNDDYFDEFNQLQSSLRERSCFGHFQEEPDDLSTSRKTVNFGNQQQLNEKSPTTLRTVTSSNDSSVSGSDVNSMTLSNGSSKCASYANRKNDNTVVDSGAGICEQVSRSSDRQDSELLHNRFRSTSSVVNYKERPSVIPTSSECSSSELSLDIPKSRDEFDNATKEYVMKQLTA
jgi:hypothetical protein